MNGVIEPTKIYTTDALLKVAGFGRDQLTKARASGIVKPKRVGKRIYYCGTEICNWIRTADDRTHKKTD